MAASRRATRIPLAAALVLAVGPAMAASWPTAKLPEDTDSATVTKHMIYNGVEMRTLIFRSRQTTDQMLAYFRKQWGPKVVANDFEGWKILGHRDGDYYVTVQVRPDGEGSRGDIGMTLIPEKRQKIELGHGVPRPDNTVVFNDIEYPDDDTAARTLAMVNKLSPQQNSAYYISKMRSDGWTNAGDNTCAAGVAGCLLNYERGKQRMTVAITRGDNHSNIVVNLTGS